MKAHLILEADGSMTILAPYNAAFLKALKDAVPYNERPYDEDGKTWRIRSGWVFPARAVVREHYNDVRVVDERQQQRPPNFTYTSGSSSGGTTWGSRSYQERMDDLNGGPGSYGPDLDFLDDLMSGRLGTPHQRHRSQEPSRGLCSSPSHHTNADACVAYLRQVYPDRSKLHVLPGAPAQVVAAAYRALSRLAHPDTGGSHEAMQELNRAYASLKS